MHQTTKRFRALSSDSTEKSVSVELGIDQRSRAVVCGQALARGGWVVHREPLSIGAGKSSASPRVGIFLVRRPRVRWPSYRDPQAGQCPEVGEVLLAASVEVDIGIPATRRRSRVAYDGTRRNLLRHDPKGLAPVHRAGPRAALRAGPRRAANEDSTLGIDTDVRFAVGVDGIDHGGDLEGDGRGDAGGRVRLRRRTDPRAREGLRRETCDAYERHAQ